MRTVLKPLAIHAAYSPVETLAFIIVVAALAYLHVLSVVKHSAFLAPPAPVLPAYALFSDEWLAVRETVWKRDHGTVPRLDLQQIVFTGASLAIPSLKNATDHVLALHPGFSHLQVQSESWTQTIEAPDGFDLSYLPADSWNIAYEAEMPGEAIAQMQSGKWVAYALRALIVRFYDLAKKAPTPDIILVVAGYILMHATFVVLFSRSRALGSSFSLPFAILSSSLLALILALPAARFLRIPMHPVALTEALPFFVCTVGFDKPIRLARAVFTHPRALRATSIPAGEVVLDAMSATYYPIIRDYILEIAVLVIGASSKVAGLSEICALAAILLAFDCLMMSTFLAAVFSIMIEVRRLPQPSTTSSTTLWPQRLFGWNNPPTPLRTSLANNKTDATEPESPIARLKLLLLAACLVLQILNLAAPFTLSSGAPRSSIPTQTTPLDWAVLAHLTPTLFESPSSTISPRLLVRLRPPIILRSSASRPLSARIDAVLSTWTSLVGDPVLSKGIVAVLVISVLLNAYLIRGVSRATGGSSVRFDSEAKVEPQPPAEETPRQDGWAREVAAIPRRPSPVPISTIHGQTPTASTGAIPTLPLEDLDRRLRARGRGLRARTPGRQRAVLVDDSDDSASDEPRSLSELMRLMDTLPKSNGLAELSDEEIVLLAQNGKIAAYALEKVLAPDRDLLGLERAVRIRRALISRASITQSLESSLVPFEQYDYSKVLGACCENVVGYIPLPLGIAGPLTIDGVSFHIPMATAEGTLVASTSRGCKALNAGGGVTTVLTQDAMTRGPAIEFLSVVEAARAKAWIASAEGYEALKSAFESTSRFAKLTSLKTAMAGRTLFVRFATATGDAMGMNMISKGTEKALEVMQEEFPEMVVLALSGNYCTDKKPAAINWIEGRGKSVVAEAVIPGKVVKSVLKTTVDALCNLNVKKNLVGSAMAGSIGGFNAHAANILTAIFLATGQDPAQNVESSNCMTLMEPTNDGQDLLMTVSMPSIEVGTVGGGTVLTPQGAVLDMLGLRGAHPTRPGQNSQGLARVVASAVMAGELSLLSALAAGHLIRAHMVHNRSTPTTPLTSQPSTPAVEHKRTLVDKLVESNLPTPLTPSSSTASLPPYSRT
ncbi:3-hydroxy-3-methylglutaryl coenzyme A reductase [Mycena indigotica]|uniref:3-hydroxy-3-methylglutaryl coenzyme A reductase n=1 Tax=Mycena indigotica TaxID=2126181 RepID=A0A8H6S5Y1_9AGAR|nr:3-hydroxy-3-methylglutaryl coenzyme A reductase [Mycena indigotica]KAF7291895.1 3-hydroxy-3-methylglutaryl coenzyme A reductase [Mycena indigotica]